jgi:lysophospholipase L1-like esterase
MNNKNGGLKSDLTNDGVHITIKGYSVMNEMAKNHIQNSLFDHF